MYDACNQRGICNTTAWLFSLIMVQGPLPSQLCLRGAEQATLLVAGSFTQSRKATPPQGACAYTLPYPWQRTQGAESSITLVVKASPAPAAAASVAARAQQPAKLKTTCCLCTLAHARMARQLRSAAQETPDAAAAEAAAML